MPQLSCESCAARKVRCDKECPCSTCKKMGITCVPVQRMRLPRGRHVHTLKAENKELRDKLEKYEHLEQKTVVQQAPVTLSIPPAPPQIAESSIYGMSSPSSSMGRTYENISVSESMHSGIPGRASSAGFPGEATQNYMPKEFWNDIRQKDPGLHDLNYRPPHSGSDSQSISSSDRRQSPSQASNSTGTSGMNGASSFMLGLGQGALRDPGAYLEAQMACRPTPEITAKLWDIYVTRVDPITRIFHQPTLRDFVLFDKPYLRYEEGDPTLNLIRASMFFIGIATLQDAQCRSLFGIEKQAAMDTYRSACELALEQVELIVTEDITVLQSFMLYLLAVRTYDRSRKTWTLFSLAVRLATAIGVNEDDYRSYEPFFDQQMRRRLWYAMCSMDAHLSFDRASKPLIAPNSRHPRLPHNLNEADFGPLSEEVLERDGITDMSLALMLYKTQATGKGMAFAAMMSKPSPDGKPDPEVIARRKEIWSDYENFMTILLGQVDPHASTSDWCLYHNGFAAFAALQLTAKRPTKGQNRQRGPVDSEPTNVLRMAVTVLEHDLLKRWDIRGESFHWHGNTLWNPLAVAVSECYTCNDVLLLQQVWPIIETHFNCLSTILAEYRQGILWQPLEKLISKVRVRVKNVVNQQAAIHNGMLAPAIYYPLQPYFPEAVLTDTMILPTNSYTGISASPEGLLPSGIASVYQLMPAPWSPLQAQPMPMQGKPVLHSSLTNGSSSSAPKSPDMSRLDPGWETWDNFLCQINFDMNVQGP